MTELVVDAELLVPPLQAPRRGTTWLLPVARYRVLDVHAGDLTSGEEIEVAHDAPDLESPAFRVGARHRLRLASELPDGALPLGGSGERVYYCTSFEVVEETR